MKTIKYLMPEEVKKVVSSVKGNFERRDKALIILAINTGLRVSELCGLNVSDILNGEIKRELKVRKEIAKGRRESVIPFNDRARNSIAEILSFNKEKGYPYLHLYPPQQRRPH